MRLEDSTREQRLIVQALMLESWAKTERKEAAPAGRIMTSFKAAIDDLPDLGDAILRTSPFFRDAVEIMLDKISLETSFL